MSAPWRLVVHGRCDGARNMGVDEALLESYAGDDPPPAPTLRLYAWKPATLSLGRGQEAARCHDPAYLRGEGMGLVRRPTGGQAVLHEHERTYAVVGRLRCRPFPGGVLETYRGIARALIETLRGLGAAVDTVTAPPRGGAAPPSTPICFHQPSYHEIVVRGRKVVGSAQLRRRGAFLQHGSILLRADPLRLGKAVGTEADGTSFAGLDWALGREPDDREVDRSLVAGFESVFDVRIEPGTLTPREEMLATRLRCWKYSSAAWTLGGRMGAREVRGAGASLRGRVS